jgi:hypothetical protein
VDNVGDGKDHKDIERERGSSAGGGGGYSTSNQYGASASSPGGVGESDWWDGNGTGAETRPGREILFGEEFRYIHEDRLGNSATANGNTLTERK